MDGQDTPGAVRPPSTPRGASGPSSASPARSADEVDRIEFDDDPLTRHADGDQEDPETSGSAELGIP